LKKVAGGGNEDAVQTALQQGQTSGTQTDGDSTTTGNTDNTSSLLNVVA
jgi:hypothetical protein